MSAPDSQDELASLVWSYLHNLDPNLADNFHNLTKAKKLEKYSPTLAQVYDHYKKTSPAVPGRSGVRPVRSPAPDSDASQKTEIYTPDIQEDTPPIVNGGPLKRPVTEIIDLTGWSDSSNETPPRKRQLKQKKTLLHTNGATGREDHGIGCLCCNPQPGPSNGREPSIDPPPLANGPMLRVPTNANTMVHLSPSVPEPELRLLAQTHNNNPPELLQHQPRAIHPRNKRIQPKRPASAPAQPVPPAPDQETPPLDHYKQMLELEAQVLIPNIDAFTCGVCLCECAPGEGVVLRECLHTFCRECLADLVRHCDEAWVVCPHRDGVSYCMAAISDREIRGLVSPGDYEARLAKTVRLAETAMQDAFHCRTPDCQGWCVHEPNVLQFPCELCGITNCLACKAIHTGETCAQYKERLLRQAEFEGGGESGAKTQKAIEKMLERGDAMHCPRCRIVVMKDPGSCDWVQCSVCKFEICWATRGPRWGPRGQGDNSGGCRCRVNGRKCHPKCKNCH